MSRLDVLKSWVRSAADGAIARLSERLPLGEAQKLFRRISQQQAWIREESLTSAAAHAEGVRQASVSCLPGRMLIDASLGQGRDVQFSLTPTRVRFAPGGAKEVAFSVEPAEQICSEIVGAVAGCIAQATWPMAFTPGNYDVGGAIVEREGAGRVRVDLRTVPSVRHFAARGPAAMMLDVMQLEAIRCEPEALVLKLKLPQVAP